MSSVVGLEQIKAAAVRIAGSVHKTDVCHDDKDINDEGDGDIDAKDSSHVVVSVFLSTKKVLTCSTLDAMTGKQLFFKAEMFQKTGSFKV